MLACSLMLSLFTLLVSAVVVHVGDSVGLDAKHEQALLAGLTRSIQEVTGREVHIDGARGCLDPPACRSDLGAVPVGDSLVLVHFHAGLDQVQVLLGRLEGDAAVASAELVVGLEAVHSELWRQVVDTLFEPNLWVRHVEIHAEPPRAWIWAAVPAGLAVIAASVSVGLAVHGDAVGRGSRGAADGALIDGARDHDAVLTGAWVSAGVGAGLAVVAGIVAVLAD